MFDIKTLATRAMHSVSDHSPLILTSLASVGVVTTAVFAAKGGSKAARILDRGFVDPAEPYIDIDPTFKDIVELTWECYIPAVLMGTATVACVIGAHSIGMRRQAALASAYTITEKALRDYQERVQELTPHQRAEFDQQRVQKNVDRDPPRENDIIATGRGDSLMQDSITGRYFYSDPETVRQAANTVNLKCINNMYASQNDFYREISLASVPIGDQMGWNTDHVMEIGLVPAVTDLERPCLVVEYYPMPKLGYYKEH